MVLKFAIASEDREWTKDEVEQALKGKADTIECSNGVFSIEGIGLDETYESLKSFDAKVSVKEVEEDEEAPLLSPEQTAAVDPLAQAAAPPPVRKAELLIDGMTCTVCSQSIENAIQNMVQKVSVNLSTDSARIEYTGDLQEIVDTIEAIGYDVTNITEETTTHKVELWINGMTCVNCSSSVEQAIRMFPVDSVAVNHATDSALVQWKGDAALLDQIIQAVEDIGYTVERTEREQEQAEDVQERWQRLQDRQENKVKSRRNAFLLSLVGTLPILMLTMVLRFHVSWLDDVYVYKHMSLRKALLWGLATPVQFGAGWEFYRSSFNVICSTSNQVIGMDVLIATGTSASYFYALSSPHFLETSVVLICFVLAGKWLQAVAVCRTSQALTQLMNLQPKTAIRVSGVLNMDEFDPIQNTYTETSVDIREIKQGDVLKVIRSTSIPADGIIVFGEMSVDESMVTGEAMPVLKGRGSTVIGGTVCVESGSNPEVLDNIGAAYVEVTGVGANTALARIVQLVTEAQSSSVPIQSFADNVASVFVPTVCFIALMAFMIWYALCSTNVVPESWYEGSDALTFSLLFSIACLVISCPCALGLATPTAVMVGTGVAARHGVLVKSGAAFEVASKIDTVVFDKTGTLTKGQPIVTDLIVIDEDTREDEGSLLQLLGSLEKQSEHPLAKAIVSYTEDRLSNEYTKHNPLQSPTSFQAITGRGASGRVGETEVAVGNRAFAELQSLDVSLVTDECMLSLEEDGKTAVFVAINRTIVAILGIADEIKDEAAKAIAHLRNRMSIDVWMITGDNTTTANTVSQLLSLPDDRVVAEALPATKLEQVKRLQSEGKIVAMVGDGINDSPALAQADVGLSLGTGTEIANEASDAVLVKGNVTDVCVAIDLSRVVFRRIQWNLLWSMIYNVFGIPIAAGVVYPFMRVRLPPTVAAVAMALSSVSVVVSSLALRLYTTPSIDEVNRPRRPSRSRQYRARQRRIRRRHQLDSSVSDDLTQPLLEISSVVTEITETTAQMDNRTLEDFSQSISEAT